MNAVYEHAVSTVKKQRPELLDKMTKSVGFAMGIEFREGSLLLSVKNNLRIRKGNYVVILITYTSQQYSQHVHTQHSFSHLKQQVKLNIV
jgi:nucleosome binding factor SPN SPT16 subunit